MSFVACSSVLLVLSGSLSHPISVSSSRIHVDGRHVQLELRCPASILNEAVPIDRNADGKLDLAELTQARAAVQAYVLERYVLSTDPDRGSTGVHPPATAVIDTPDAGRIELDGGLVGITLVGAGEGGALPAEPWVQMELAFECAWDLASLRIDSTLFQEADPWHRDQAEIVWNGTAQGTRLVWLEDPTWSFTPSSTPSTPSNGIVLQFVRLGVEHILTGYDHIAFLIALIVASRRVRSLLGVVTAFTLAHSLSLACAATGTIEVSPRIVEPLIALSIAYVGCRNLFDRRERRVWLEAFGFGLVHGLGFAGSIAETLAAEKAKLAALFGFNVGVELGQLSIVLVLIAALRVLAGTSPRREAPVDERSREAWARRGAGLAPPWILRPASFMVAALGLYWFVVRAADF